MLTLASRRSMASLAMSLMFILPGCLDIIDEARGYEDWEDWDSDFYLIDPPEGLRSSGSDTESDMGKCHLDGLWKRAWGELL